MNELVLLESRTARTDRLTDVNDDRALETINKAKALLMAMWQGTGIATTAQIAEYYEVPEDTLKKVYQRNNEEFALDGVKVLKGKDLGYVRDILSLSETRRTSLMIWTPRAALRLGMLLRDSLVAQKVRTLLLNVAEQQPKSIQISPSGTTQLLLPEIPKKKLALKLVNDESFRSNLKHQFLFRQAYDELKYRFDYDIYHKRCKGSKLDRIEDDGHLDNLIAIMQNLWTPNTNT